MKKEIFYIHNEDVLWDRFLLFEEAQSSKSIDVKLSCDIYSLDRFAANLWLFCVVPMSEGKLVKLYRAKKIFNELNDKELKSTLKKTLSRLYRLGLLKKSCDERKLRIPPLPSMGISAEYLKWQEVFPAPPHLFALSWNWTNKCNMNCSHCYSRAESFEHELTTVQSLSCAQQICDSGVFDVSFGGGECLMREDFFDILSYLCERNVDCRLSSNGWHFDRATADRLLHTGLFQINFSLDSVSEDIHDELRRARGSYKRVIRSVRIAKKAGLRVSLLSMLTRQNITSLQEMIDFSLHLGVDEIAFKIVKEVGNASDNKCIIPKQDDFIDAIHYLADVTEKYSKRLDINYGQAAEPLVRKILEQYYGDSFDDIEDAPIGCHCGETTLCIKADGDVTPCSYIPISVGNTMKNHLRLIWLKSQALNLMRREKQKKEGQACSRGKPCPELCIAQILARDSRFRKRVERISCKYKDLLVK